MNMSIGIVLANSLWFIPIALLAVVLFKAVRKGLLRYRVSRQANQIRTCSIDTDCPPNHICVKGLCVPESKLEELISSLA